MESEKINLGENTNGYIKLIKNTKGYNWEIKMFKSDNLWTSLASASNWAGFKTKTTVTAKIAKIAMTIRSSIKVKPFFII